MNAMLTRRRALSLTAALVALGPSAAFAGKRSAAPDFTLKSIKGKRVRLSDYKGKVVVVNFWATWCAPCLQELPFLDALHRKYEKKGAVVLAIATDGPETTSKIKSTARRGHWKMPVLHDKSGTAVAKLNPRGQNPYTVFIDRHGNVAWRHEGYANGDEKKYEKVLKKLLAEAA